MPLGTLDRNPPPFFKQGPSALSKLMVFSAVALFLMVADTRFRISQPVRAVVGTVLYPVQWVAMRPVFLARYGGQYFESLMVPGLTTKCETKKQPDYLYYTMNNTHPERVGYPTQKPLWLLEQLLPPACPKGGLVVDFFCGSGTTLVAAKKHGFHYIGCDVNPEAIVVTDARLEAGV